MRYNTKSYPSRESNDCSVRALAAAAGVTYTVAYKAFAKAGRLKKRGVYLSRLIRTNKLPDFVFEPVVNKQINVVRSVGGTGICAAVTPQPTLKQFIRKYPVGSYLVTKVGHAFAVRDSIVIDANRPGPRVRIDGAWRVQVASQAVPWYQRTA